MFLSFHNADKKNLYLTNILNKIRGKVLRERAMLPVDTKNIS